MDKLLLGTVGAKGQCYEFAVADVNVDNNVDLVFPNPDGSAVAYLNTRVGPFERFDLTGLDGHTHITSFDIDNDGDSDLVGGVLGTEVPFRVA